MIMNTARLMSFTKFLHVDFSSYKLLFCPLNEKVVVVNYIIKV